MGPPFVLAAWKQRVETARVEVLHAPGDINCCLHDPLVVRGAGMWGRMRERGKA